MLVMSNSNNNNGRTIDTTATSKPYTPKEHEVAQKIGTGVAKGINMGINLFGKGVRLLAKGATKLDEKVNK